MVDHPMWQYRSEPLAIRWEYQLIPRDLVALNEAGAAGWELCHATHDYYLMKRLGLRQQTTDAGARDG
jgi:hypothetical protein